MPEIDNIDELLKEYTQRKKEYDELVCQHTEATKRTNKEHHKKEAHTY